MDVAGHRILIRKAAGLATLLTCLCLASVGQQSAAPANSSATQKSGTLVDLHSNKRVVQTGRWMVVREFTIDFAVQCPGQLYCGELTTAVANEADDLASNTGKSVAVAASGKDLDLTLSNGRHVKAHVLAVNKCPIHQ